MMTDPVDIENADMSNVETIDVPAFNKMIIAEFRANGGAVGGVLAGKNLLLMTTTGAKSGEPRVSPVGYLEEGDRIVVIASNGGQDRHPAWYHNLKANPELTVELGRRAFPAVASEVTGPERAELFARMAEVDPTFAGYGTKTDRTIPVFQLVRKDAT